MKVGFVGLGKLGLPCAEVISQKFQTFGYDVAETNSRNVNLLSSLKDLSSNSEIIFVAVPTPHHRSYGGETPTSHLEKKDFDYSVVISVLKELNKLVNSNHTIILISTVLPGTIRRLFASIVTNCELVYNPYLIAMGSVEWDMVNPEMIIMGTHDGSKTTGIQRLETIYQSIMQNNPRYILGTWEEAECIKVFYNTFISTKISLVNMILDVSEKLGHIDSDVVASALAHSSKRIMGPQYMKPGLGDAGGCHPRDNIALSHLSQSLNLNYDLFGTIMHSREVQAENLAKKLVEIASENQCEIVIHGKAYKPLVPYIDGSYSLLVAYYCQEKGSIVKFNDPMTGDSYVPTKPCVILLAHDPQTTYQYTTDQNLKSERKMYFEIPDGSIVVDPWRSYIAPSNKNIKVIWYGNTR